MFKGLTTILQRQKISGNAIVAILTPQEEFHGEKELFANFIRKKRFACI